MALPEQIVLEASELLTIWDAVIENAAGLSRQQKLDFAEVVADTGIIQNIAELRQAALDPQAASERGDETDKLIDDVAVDLEVLNQAVETSKRLGVAIRTAVAGTVQRAELQLTTAEEERILAANVQAIVPAVISVIGGGLVALLTSLILK